MIHMLRITNKMPLLPKALWILVLHSLGYKKAHAHCSQVSKDFANWLSDSSHWKLFQPYWIPSALRPLNQTQSAVHIFHCEYWNLTLIWTDQSNFQLRYFFNTYMNASRMPCLISKDLLLKNNENWPLTHSEEMIFQNAIHYSFDPDEKIFYLVSVSGWGARVSTFYSFSCVKGLLKKRNLDLSRFRSGIRCLCTKDEYVYIASSTRECIFEKDEFKVCRYGRQHLFCGKIFKFMNGKYYVIDWDSNFNIIVRPFGVFANRELKEYLLRNQKTEFRILDLQLFNKYLYVLRSHFGSKSWVIEQYAIV